MEILEKIIEVKDKTQLRNISLLFSEAFLEDPLWKLMFTNKNKRIKKINLFFKIILRYIYLTGKIFIILKENSELAGSIAVHHLNNTSLSILSMIRAGAWKFIFSPIIFRFIKYRKILNKVNKIHEKLVDYPHYYIDLVAVNPKFQGKRYSSKLINHVKELSHLPIYLETMNPKNVKIYEHLGFIVINHLHFGEYDIGLWSMLFENQ